MGGVDMVSSSMGGDLFFFKVFFHRWCWICFFLSGGLMVWEGFSSSDCERNRYEAAAKREREKECDIDFL